MSDPPADPFGERIRGGRRWRRRLLGADFIFETDSKAVERLVRQAFEGLPRHRLSPKAPVLHVRIVLRRRTASARRGPPPAPRFAGGAGLVTSTIDADNYAVLAPRQRSALIVVSNDMLQHDYHLRYELLEFAVITLAVRTLGLVPLHAACLALRGRGVLLLGASGSGKSTLTLQGASAGLELLSEDSLFIDPRGLLAAGLPNYLYVRAESPRSLVPPGVARPLARARFIRRRSGVRKRELDLRRAPLVLARRAPRIVALVLLSPRRARGGKLLLRQPAGCAGERLRATQAYAAARPEWSQFVRKMARLPCFELRRSAHPSEAVVALKELLGQVMVRRRSTESVSTGPPAR